MCAFILRGKRCAYDNIAASSATGQERPISGETVTVVETYGGGRRTSTSNADEWHSNVQAGSSVSDQAADGTGAGGAMHENYNAGGVTNTRELLG